MISSTFFIFCSVDEPLDYSEEEAWCFFENLFLDKDLFCEEASGSFSSIFSVEIFVILVSFLISGLVSTF